MKNVKVFTLCISLTMLLNSCAMLTPKAGINLAEIHSKRMYSTEIPDSENDNTGDNTGDDTGDNTGDDTDLPTKMYKNKSRDLVTRNVKSKDNKTGFYVGVAVSDISITKRFKLQPEINFVGVEDFNQIQLPVLLKYNFTNKISAYTGPNFGFLLDATTELKTFNFSVDLGVSYAITNKFLVGIRYDYGVSNLLKNANNSNYVRINNLQIGAAYKLNFKK